MKDLIIIFCLIFLISLTAIVKTSSKKIEEEVFVLKDKLSLLKDKYSIVSFEHTYLSKPSRLIQIMKDHKNEEYTHLEISDFKTLSKYKQKPLISDFSKNDQK